MSPRQYFSLKQSFCRQLASWLYSSEWHFTTLLASCIHAVDELPSNADQLVNTLLHHYPNKPKESNINNFLKQSSIIESWFLDQQATPKVLTLNLTSNTQLSLVHPQLPPLNTPHELAAWLNITDEQLHWLADIKRHDSATPPHLVHYHYHTQQKQNGDNRLLESPKVQLKAIQRKILDHIISHSPTHSAAHGFLKKKNCQGHASLHINKQYLFLFDLSHCFFSTQWLQVYRVFTQLGYPTSVAKYLTGCCTHRAYLNYVPTSRLDGKQKSLLKRRHLPQGAPSSPALSNTILYQLDKRLTNLANKLKMTYSRYADDLAFSSNTHRNWGFFEPLVGNICLDEGFELNHRKSRVMQPHQKQCITGIVVNKKVNIDRRYYDRLKATLTNCLKYGLDSQNHLNHANFKAYLLGQIHHVKSLNNQKGKKLEAIYNQL